MVACEPERRRGFPLWWVLLAIVIIALLVRTIDVLLVLFLAVILAVYLDAVAGFLHRRLNIPQGLALGTAVALTLGALVGVVFLIVPAVASQVQDFITNLPSFLTELDRSQVRERLDEAAPRRGGAP